MFASISPPKTEYGRVLLQMWFLLRDRRNWTKGALALDAAGESTDCRGHEAVCWCVGGALNRAVGDAVARFELLLGLAAVHYPMSLDQFNDSPTTSHKDVLDLIIRAYDRVEPNQS